MVGVSWFALVDGAAVALLAFGGDVVAGVADAVEVHAAFSCFLVQRWARSGVENSWPAEQRYDVGLRRGGRGRSMKLGFQLGFVLRGFVAFETVVEAGEVAVPEDVDRGWE
jgi:hypothetical protein